MIRVYVSSVIDASADTVWARIRDFNGLPQWHPGIADSRIENSEPSRPGRLHPPLPHRATAA